MTRVSATEFKNNIGTFSDAAMQEPVIITSHQRDRLVLMSAEEYRRLTDSSAATLTDERKRQIRERANYHRDTIIELAQR
ncbi:MAG: type II toxin-antitoxin system Phd/YefM family antitoxin [Thalassospira sp.]|uniref:type II toxin-antitoxin system Phd/YefM family antitoxin n=1 Tax=Thalassospira sp. TaxID=1912094 RepID=UPI0032EDCEDC